ncbi:hypoxanthine phosphoribosyltransferase [Haploplasma modicum]|uniref:hypoxanthine phosphoribosyltransferase n=1 Tax=Haploplasma modicum TaxID=2150 RepID=UPI00047A1111|nr:hypoxanthine phosphoribosyltransferase [Haploplasma modicum]MCR1809185.1 hypoxanthine phosphoribosyltransferase [Haploplasma modicum]
MNEILESILISKEQINEACITLGKQITKDYEGKDTVLVGLLKGCIPFLSDLSKEIDLPVETQYMIASSYHGTTTSSEVHIKYDLEIPIEGKHILLVEDIVDTGQTINAIIKLLKNRKAASIEVVTLLNKVDNNNLKPKYIGFTIPNKFVVGYGLDFQEKYRNLPYIGVLKKELYDK